MQEEVKKRSIQSLYHFTKLENIDSIMRNGIIPRNKLDEFKVKYEFNDSVRLDFQEGASSFSIEHPNYKMFYPCRMQNKAQEWVVIGVQRNVLWDKDCAFCHENAASANVTAIPIAQRKDREAFERMFEPVNGKPSRAELKLSSNLPTNPQAEVLVFGTVESSYILALICDSIKLRDELKAKYPQVNVVRHLPAFSPRMDYEAWR